MTAIRETCSICSTAFEVQFRYQMEEREGGFSFFCSQACLERSHRGKSEDGKVCDCCGKRFQVELAAQLFYIDGRRRYACTPECRTQLFAEAKGARLADDLKETELPSIAAPPPAPPLSSLESGYPEPGLPRLYRQAPQPFDTRVPPSVVRGGTPAPGAPSLGRAPSAPVASSSGPRIIAVFNHKGGTGKTTTAVSLSAGIAERGKRVLLVDTDAQGNVSVSLNAKAERSLYHVIVMGLAPEQAAQRVRDNLDLLPSNETLAAAELYLAGRKQRDRVLRQRLEAFAASYDYVVIDCSPSLSLMNQNALVFADSVLVPVACDYLSLVGVRQVLKTVKNVNSLLHHPVRVWGVLPTFFDTRARICHEAVAALTDHFGPRCLPPIRSAIKVKEAPSQGQTIFEYAAGSNAAEDYRGLVDRVILDAERPMATPQPIQQRAVEARAT